MAKFESDEVTTWYGGCWGRLLGEVDGGGCWGRLLVGEAGNRGGESIGLKYCSYTSI